MYMKRLEVAIDLDARFTGRKPSGVAVRSQYAGLAKPVPVAPLWVRIIDWLLA